MAKDYWMRFGSGDPQNSSGLAPTFIIFIDSSGGAVAPPAITEPDAGSGLYTFSYGPTQSIAFIADGATSGLASSVRYVSGSLDPVDAIDQTGATLVAMGTTLTAIGETILATVNAHGSSLSTLIGSTASSFGSTSTDPGDLFGYLKRAMEVQEGNATFLNSTGEWSILSRGSSTLLRVKTLTNAATGTTKI